MLRKLGKDCGKRLLEKKNVVGCAATKATTCGCFCTSVFDPQKRKFGRLLALPRMGSLISIPLTALPKIQNDDILDEDISRDLPAEMTRDELLKFCRATNCAHPMFKRCFRKVRKNVNNNDDSEIGMLNARKLNSLSKGCGDYEVYTGRDSIRVFQWNILSQSLGQHNDNFVHCPDAALEWRHRRFRLVEEMIEYDPDIICLQEVDHFNFLSHVLATQGYVGCFYPKPESLCLRHDDNNGPDGCAIFYKQAKFELRNRECRILEMMRVRSNQVVLMCNLHVKGTEDDEICVATTHLKARKGALLAALRNEQGKDLLACLARFRDHRPLVLCGDFNAEPIEPVYDTLTKQLRSAYADPHEPQYTTWKVRGGGEGEICHTIDYIFYDDCAETRLEVEAILEMPRGEEIGVGRIPSLQYPSDHFSLVADFRIKR